MINFPNESITETGNGDTGVRHSTETQVGKKKAAPSSDQLVKALEQSNAINAQLVLRLEAVESELATVKSNQNSASIESLAKAIVSATQPQVNGPIESDNINRSSDFRNTKAMVDGRNMMEAQQSLQEFRNEVKKPISIPKSMANFLGPNLNVTVNGIRVSIPCDGKTYYINETHYEHARERMAKVDLQEAAPDQLETINA
jgi:hypothetical protein